LDPRGPTDHGAWQRFLKFVASGKLVMNGDFFWDFMVISLWDKNW
jgi:hypothetical protein